MAWYFQYTPGDMWDYDEVGTHILFERVINGQPRKLVTHPGRNGFVYTMERNNGAMVGAKAYTEVNWTAGIDQKTGRPLDYDPSKDVQLYSGLGAPSGDTDVKKVCPNRNGGNNYYPSAYSRRTQLLYVPSITSCEFVSHDRDRPKTEKGWFARSGGSFKVEDRYESDLTAIDPATLEIKKKIHFRYPNYAGALATAGGLVFIGLLDGTVAAYDDTDARRTVEGQCRRGPRRATDQFRGQRPAIYRHRLGTEPAGDSKAAKYRGTQQPAQRNRALRIRAVSFLWPDERPIQRTTKPNGRTIMTRRNDRIRAALFGATVLTVTGDRRRRDAGTAPQPRPRAAELADQPPQL